MTGWIVAALLLVTIVAVGWPLYKSSKTSQKNLQAFLQGDLERAGRRRRVFDVLHTLSNAILHGQTDTTLHRLITEGAVRVVQSQGAILYLLDEKGEALVPRHCTKNCPPLISLPERIVNQARTNAGTLPSFLRLHSIAPGEGVIGSVFSSQKEENVPDLRENPNFKGKNNPFQQHVAALIAPLNHGGRHLGVLAAASDSTVPFTDHELEMFVALARQCGFALGNAQAHQEANAKKALEAELRNASEIQRILLPETAPDIPGFEIAARNVPARLVSGDYYDFFPIGTSHVGVAIADVCGKGIPASLLTAMCRSVLRANARENLSPAGVMSLVNRNLFPDIREDMFITAIYAVLSADGRSLMLARAGHTSPLIWRKATGKVEEVKAPGLAVGVDKGNVFDRITRDVNVSMETGDVMLLYTDGVDEATDHKGLLFGVDRIKTVLGLAAPNGAQAVIQALCDAITKFMGGDPQTDDITLVAVRKK